MNINSTYINFVNDILQHGEEVKKNDGDRIIETLGNHYFIDNPLNDMNDLFYNHDHLLSCIKRGFFDIEGNPINAMSLYQYVNSASDISNQHDFVYTYPNRLFNHFKYPYNSFGQRLLDNTSTVNQYECMLSRLRECPGSNRSVAVLFDPSIDNERQDIPCLNWLQFIIRNNQLTLHCMFRSNDIFTAFYSNMYLLTYWGLQMTEDLKWGKDGFIDLEFKGIDYHSTSAHIYKSAIDEAEHMIKVNK